MEQDKLKKVLESLLFVSETPLTAKKIASFVKDVTVEEAQSAMTGLQEEINALDRSFQVIQIAEGFQLVTRPEYHKWAKELYKVITKTRLSKPSMEALAIIAYKQPVTRAEIEAIRGVEVSNLIQSLLEKRMVRILGRAETPGRPLLYGTTQEFLVHFGLKDLVDLPKVSEIQELAGDRPSPEFLKEMEGELRRRETKMGLSPVEAPVLEGDPEGPSASEGTPPEGTPSGTTPEG
ncbi:MAG TPA: SMC-Scp complex subunit ScpB [bacterium]|nr:SMC-Scp complex subunit ScpB [bacterium]